MSPGPHAGSESRPPGSVCHSKAPLGCGCAAVRVRAPLGAGKRVFRDSPTLYAGAGGVPREGSRARRRRGNPGSEWLAGRESGSWAGPVEPRETPERPPLDPRLSAFLPLPFLLSFLSTITKARRMKHNAEKSSSPLPPGAHHLPPASPGAGGIQWESRVKGRRLTLGTHLFSTRVIFKLGAGSREGFLHRHAGVCMCVCVGARAPRAHARWVRWM